MNDLQALKELLSSPKNIVVTTHHKPDADALGSSLALAAFLAKKDHQVKVVSPSDYPAFLEWMHGNGGVIVFEGNNQKLSEQLIADADIIFCLDFNSLDRINQMGELVAKSKAIKVVIDHHLEPEKFADFEFLSLKAAATAELTYNLIRDLDEEHLIDENIANCLYAGIMTDTGGFKHPSTSKEVHLITAKLIELGADVTLVAKLIYDNNTLDRLKFLGFALSERLTVLEQYKTAYFAISAADLKRFNSQTGDTEGLVNYALSIKGVVMAAVIIDRVVTVKLSFRSIGNFSVNDLAREHFQGGGHKNAAGGKSSLSFEETVSKFTTLLGSYKEQLNNTLIVSTP